jgi:hypothetical protein
MTITLHDLINRTFVVDMTMMLNNLLFSKRSAVHPRLLFSSVRKCNVSNSSDDFTLCFVAAKDGHFISSYQFPVCFKVTDGVHEQHSCHRTPTVCQ